MIQEDITKERILKVAEELFAEKGYDAVTVREITGKAKCNLSLVYYYFGSKKKLYLEVFKKKWVSRALAIQNSFFQALEAQKPSSLEEIIRILTTVFLEGKMESDNLAHHQLIAREFQKPTEALDIVFKEVMKPFFTKLQDLITPYLDPSLPKEKIIFSLYSIIGQIIHFAHSKNVIPKLLERPLDQTVKKMLIEHISHFSVYGITGPIK